MVETGILFELLHAFDFESPSEILLRTLLSIVDVLVWSVTSIPSLSFSLFNHSHPKVWAHIRVVVSRLCRLGDLPLRKVVMTCRSGC
jgi:hypothetical protein